MILVDGVTEYETTLRYKSFSHMVSTVGRDELHAMADKLGLKRAWFQTGSFDHYDIVPTKRALAIQHGAVAVNSRILLFGNFDYALRRPGREVPEPYRSELAALAILNGNRRGA